jgi:hypothetical protein
MSVDLIKQAIRDIPDFPKPGIFFKDITPVLGDPKLFDLAVSLLAGRHQKGSVEQSGGGRVARVHFWNGGGAGAGGGGGSGAKKREAAPLRPFRLPTISSTAAPRSKCICRFHQTRRTGSSDRRPAGHRRNGRSNRPHDTRIGRDHRGKWIF